jgi:uncharacterized protein (TIGR02611 family)
MAKNLPIFFRARLCVNMNSVASKSFFQKLQRAVHWHQLSPTTRRVIAGTLGGLVLVIGVAMLVLPGPAFVMIPLGLAILSTEFVWARRWLKKVRDRFRKLRKKK